jgi:hypothetical protein
MDETRFDALRRALVAVSPRRGLMSLLGGLTLGGSLPVVLGAPETEAKKVRASKKKKKSGKSKPGPQGPQGAQGARGPAGSFTCPSGTLLHEGVCIETTKRSIRDFETAQLECLDAGRRLPTLAELQTFRLRSGQDMNTSFEHTNHAWIDGAESVVLQVDNTGFARQSTQSSISFFRWVAAAN